MRAALLALLLATAGCPGLVTVHSSSYGYSSVNGEPMMRGGIYTGAECKTPEGNPPGDVRYGEGQRDRFLEGPRREIGWPIEKQILGLICVHATSGTNAVIPQHDAFDDRHYDHLAAAMMILDCDVSTACNLDNGRLALGLMTWYVANTDLDQVAKRLADVPITAKARQFFLTRVEQAARHIETMATQLDPRRRRLYVEIPNAVHDARAAYFKTNASLYTRLDAVIEHAEENRKKGRVSQAVYAALEGLRAEYLKDCGREECRFDPFFTDVTRELALLHLAGRDPVGVLAENALLRGEDANRNGYGPSIMRAQYTAMQKEAADYQRYEQARRQGVDEGALRQSFGGTAPIEVDPSTVWSAGLGFPDFAAAVRDDDTYTSEQISVASVDVKSEIVTLKPSYGDGAVYVPKAEGEHVKAGEVCRVVITRKDRDGLIVECSERSGGKITQLRGTRL